MVPRGAILGLALLGVVGAAIAPRSLLAQETTADSIQAEVRARLARLNRGLGDSTNLVPVDTAGRPTLRSAGTDSTLQSLLRLPGYDLTRYSGESADFETRTRVLTLIGADGRHAVLTREGIQLSADSALVFDEKTGRLVTVGKEAVYTPDQGEAVTTTRIIYDLNENRGTAEEAKTSFAQGPGNFFVTGRFPYVSPEVAYGVDGVITSCELEEPHYHFSYDEIKTIPGGTMVAKNVKLYFADVPVFWLPFIAQSTKQGRRSGLLPIRFSINDIVSTSSTYNRRISNLGFYWAMSDYTDADLAVDWWSGNYMAVTGGFRYRWLKQFLDGGVNFRQFWREGRNEQALDTRHSWEISERTKLRMSARFISNSDFLKQNSFDPREVTQTIDSEGGLNHRFSWGNLSMTANRRKYISDDRVIMTFPQASLSLSTITLLPAVANQARFYNNMTWSASGNFSRQIEDKPDQIGEVFSVNLADLSTINGGLSSSLNLGRLSIGGNVSLRNRTELDVPLDFYDPPEASPSAGTGSIADLMGLNRFAQGGAADGFGNFSRQELNWSSSINYQQTLVGSTTLTPTLQISGRSIKADTSSVAQQSFIAAPQRLAFGADLKTDIYGMFGGFGRFDLIRHKFSPSASYAYSPATQPSEIQAQLFGANAIQPKNEIRFSLNNTWEARVATEDGDSTEVAASPSPSAPTGSPVGGAPRGGAGGGPSRAVQQQKVTLLALRTSAFTFDFVKADSLGSTRYGFADNLAISQTISSDFLRGLNVSFVHDVFDNRQVDSESGLGREIDFHLSSLNLGFSLSNRSTVFRWISRMAGFEEGPEDTSAADEEEGLDEFDEFDEFVEDDFADASILPGLDDRSTLGASSRSRDGQVGQWSANLSYSLLRPRGDDDAARQMLQSTFRFKPSEKWSVNWRTSYDVELSRFNDHIITLKRDLHRWEADFSFRQTATGNWSFMFEVVLIDNRDLKFDYEQRSVDRFR